MKYALRFLLAVLGVINARRLSTRDADWNDLKVTFGVNPFESFQSVPRKLQDATKAGWTYLDEQCSSSSKSFRGYRYFLKGDPAVILIYDGNGFIAGIQTAIDTTKVSYAPTSFTKDHPFVSDGKYLTLTAYFVDPSTICAGRTDGQFGSQGTGTGLWIQNNTNPERSTLLPRKEADITTTKWTQGKCTWAMGMHYWYDITADMSCDDFFPMFLLYNKGEMFGFGWAINAGLTSSRYEHPTASISGNFINPVPKCFFTDPTYTKLSTMHIYMTSDPQGVFC